MEERAAERARLKAERDEKRRKAEEERLVRQHVALGLHHCQAKPGFECGCITQAA